LARHHFREEFSISQGLPEVQSKTHKSSMVDKTWQ